MLERFTTDKYSSFLDRVSYKENEVLWMP